MWTTIGILGLIALIMSWGKKIVDVIFYIIAAPLIIPLSIILFIKYMIDWYKEVQASKSSSVE